MWGLGRGMLESAELNLHMLSSQSQSPATGRCQGRYTAETTSVTLPIGITLRHAVHLRPAFAWAMCEDIQPDSEHPLCENGYALRQ